MKFRKKPVVIEATQWFKLGDHLKVVSYPYVVHDDKNDKCNYCYNELHLHGWLPTLEGGHIVCPNDWIIKEIAGEFYPCKPDIFEQTYEKVGDEWTLTDGKITMCH